MVSAANWQVWRLGFDSSSESKLSTEELKVSYDSFLVVFN